MKIFLIIMVFILTSVSISYGQETEVEMRDKKNLTFSATVDTYFKFNISGTNESISDQEDDPLFLTPNTFFANRSGFSFGMVNLVAKYDGEKVGFVSDLVFGPRGEQFVFLSDGSSNIVNQLYVYWKPTDKMTITMGNFNTFFGYEALSPSTNFNYSTSYMFSFGPFAHTGIKTDIKLSEDSSLMLGIMNSNDFTEVNIDGSYSFGGQFGYKEQYLNVIYGNQTNTSDTTFQVDFTGKNDITENFFLGVNAVYSETGQSKFYGVALYPQYQVSKPFGIGLRGEYFSELSGGVGGIGLYDGNGDASVYAFTLTGNYTIDDLIIKPEFRIDSTSEKTFIDNNMNPSNSLSSFLIAAIYKFN